MVNSWGAGAGAGLAEWSSFLTVSRSVLLRSQHLLRPYKKPALCGIFFTLSILSSLSTGSAEGRGFFTFFHWILRSPRDGAREQRIGQGQQHHIRRTAERTDRDDENELSAESRLYIARVTLEYHQMAEKYGICLAYLKEAARENELLRQENARLRLANEDLSKRLNLLTSSGSSADYSPVSLMSGFETLNIGTASQNRRSNISDLSETSPTSVFGFQEDRFERRTPERCTLPKSISIRSSGFLKMAQGNGSGASASASSSRGNRTRVSNPVNVGSVYVPGGKKDEEALELEVYNQGMFKTELCNKWQETGACPYGNHCQFAHGIGELRPVIRHPRYKTEVCRMVLAGDSCPYGHRCHFRHSITDQDRIASPR
ncbi:zinc finger CCCH domain-containing protein 15 [Aristolochia californica]|uniref:zinc finger CCCH domain-containing protein 15 n=1 Tax=Aristolochia californica TaxID=171875 RepID=UPI0035D77328